MNSLLSRIFQSQSDSLSIKQHGQGGQAPGMKAFLRTVAAVGVAATAMSLPLNAHAIRDQPSKPISEVASSAGETLGRWASSAAGRFQERSASTPIQDLNLSSGTEAMALSMQELGEHLIEECGTALPMDMGNLALCDANVLFEVPEGAELANNYLMNSAANAVMEADGGLKNYEDSEAAAAGHELATRMAADGTTGSKDLDRSLNLAMQAGQQHASIALGDHDNRAEGRFAWEDYFSGVTSSYAEVLKAAEAEQQSEINRQVAERNPFL